MTGLKNEQNSFSTSTNITYIYISNLRRFVKQELIKSHDEYIKGIIDTDGKDNGSKFKISKKFWSYVRTKRRDTTRTGIPVLKVDGKEITAGREKVEALSKQYDSIFTNEDLTNIPCLLTPPAPRIKELTLDVNGVQKSLKNLDPKKANGPDKVSTLYSQGMCGRDRPNLNKYIHNITNNWYHTLVMENSKYSCNI